MKEARNFLRVVRPEVSSEPILEDYIDKITYKFSLLEAQKFRELWDDVHELEYKMKMILGEEEAGMIFHHLDKEGSRLLKITEIPLEGEFFSLADHFVSMLYPRYGYLSDWVQSRIFKQARIEINKMSQRAKKTLDISTDNITLTDWYLKKIPAFAPANESERVFQKATFVCIRRDTMMIRAYIQKARNLKQLMFQYELQ